MPAAEGIGAAAPGVTEASSQKRSTAEDRPHGHSDRFGEGRVVERDGVSQPDDGRKTALEPMPAKTTNTTVGSPRSEHVTRVPEKRTTQERDGSRAREESSRPRSTHSAPAQDAAARTNSRDKRATSPTRAPEGKGAQAPATSPTRAPEKTRGESAGNRNVVSIASGLRGIPYVWGGTTVKGFDCSGFTQYVFRKAGIELPRTAAQQQAATTKVSKPQPGDLVFFGSPAYHVGVYAGDGRMYDAPRRGKTTGIRTIWSTNVTYGRAA